MRALLLVSCCAIGCSRGEHASGALPRRPAPLVATASSAPAAPPLAGPSELVPAAAADTPDWREVPFGQLCVTSGPVSPGVDGSFIILGPTFRAESGAGSDGVARLTFEYIGSTAETKALGPGAARHQIGLKLRAQDPCNLLYVMWRLFPVNEVVVSVKRNTGHSNLAQCSNHGYTNLTPEQRAAPRPATPGSDHVLAARIIGSRLDVWVDELLVWRGELGVEAQRLHGSVGVRSDNVKARGRLAVEPGTSSSFACHPGEPQD